MKSNCYLEARKAKEADPENIIYSPMNDGMEYFWYDRKEDKYYAFEMAPINQNIVEYNEDTLYLGHVIELNRHYAKELIDELNHVRDTLWDN